ncbi:hypothetical protein GCM10025866_22680 [Naasia aerilata]|uniref:Peptidase S26 domain-containing protein n=1 Tax=Naasia aerilata TaxID=1162966 RepID=A0ABM8GDJ6_9MICO|nr:hypothetical protein GCM10025866_22680 [Naasia aerilata]
MPDPGQQETRREARQKGRRNRSAVLFLRDVLVILVVAILVSFLIKTFLIRSFYIPSASMEDTLEVNDRIIVNQLEPSLFPSRTATSSCSGTRADGCRLRRRSSSPRSSPPSTGSSPSSDCPRRTATTT